jgi:hypothetical protein
MGISLKIFLVNDDDSIQPLALARYDRLFARNPKELIPQYAGKRVRYALVVVNLINREPIEILRIQYSYLSFDSTGRIDPAYIEEETRLGFDILPPLLIKPGPRQVIDARHEFAKKRFDRQYKWEPTPEIESAIFNLIFKK